MMVSNMEPKKQNNNNHAFATGAGAPQSPHQTLALRLLTLQMCGHVHRENTSGAADHCLMPTLGGVSPQTSSLCSPHKHDTSIYVGGGEHCVSMGGCTHGCSTPGQLLLWQDGMMATGVWIPRLLTHYYDDDDDSYYCIDSICTDSNSI